MLFDDDLLAHLKAQSSGIHCDLQALQRILVVYYHTDVLCLRLP